MNINLLSLLNQFSSAKPMLLAVAACLNAANGAAQDTTLIVKGTKVDNKFANTTQVYRGDKATDEKILDQINGDYGLGDVIMITEPPPPPPPVEKLTTTPPPFVGSLRPEVPSKPPVLPEIRSKSVDLSRQKTNSDRKRGDLKPTAKPEDITVTPPDFNEETRTTSTTSNKKKSEDFTVTPPDIDEEARTTSTTSTKKEPYPPKETDPKSGSTTARVGLNNKPLDNSLRNNPPFATGKKTSITTPNSTYISTQKNSDPLPEMGRRRPSLQTKSPEARLSTPSRYSGRRTSGFFPFYGKKKKTSYLSKKSKRKIKCYKF